MTRDAILKCLTDRPCDVCVFHADGHCQTWNCVFEEEPDDAEDCEDKRMTREEAIAKLKNFADHCYPNEEFLMAIKALSAEPCEDCISRQAVLDTLDTTDKFMDEERTVETYKALLKECYETLSPVTPKQSDVFDKIRAEIEQTADEEQKHDEKWAIGLRYAVKIIDKYKAENMERQST